MPKKKPGSVHTAKNGARYKIMPNGRARFISGPTKGRGAKKTAKKKGGSVRVGGSVLSALGRRASNMAKRSVYGSAVRAGVSSARSAVRSARSAPRAAMRIASGARKSIRSAPAKARRAARGFVRGTIRTARGGAKAANYALGGSVPTRGR